MSTPSCKLLDVALTDWGFYYKYRHRCGRVTWCKHAYICPGCGEWMHSWVHP